MPWFYVDDGFSDSKPVLNMPDRYRLGACGLWVLAGSWSAKEELDGFVPDAKLRQLGARPPIVAALTDPGAMSAPLCTRVSGGIQFNSWEKWQPTKAELEAERVENARKREADAERKRAERAAKNEADPERPRRRRKGRNAVTSANGHQPPVVDADRSTNCPNGHQPDVTRDSRAHAGARLDPTRPDPTRMNTSGHLDDDTPLPPEPPPGPYDQPPTHGALALVPQHVDNPPTPARRQPSSAARTVIRQELGTAGYPRATLERLAIQAEKLYHQHAPDRLIRHALREWDRRPNCDRPEYLETVYSDLVKRQRADTKPSASDAAYAAAQALKNQPTQQELT